MVNRCQCLVPCYSLTLNIEIEIRNLKSTLKIKIDNWNWKSKLKIKIENRN